MNTVSPLLPQQEADSSSQSLRVARIEVDRLFGIYDHHFDLNLTDHVTLIHGPNGIGKTVILKMMNALFTGDFTLFRQIPFLRFFVRFHDGTSLEGTKDTLSENEGRFKLEFSKHGQTEASIIHVKSEAEHIASQVKYIEPHKDIPNTWIDTRDGEQLSTDTLISRYRNRVPPENYQEVAWYNAFRGRVNSHFIQEQRLFQIARPETRQQRHLWPGDHTEFVSTVLVYSDHFHDLLDKTMAYYGRQSQALDQSFPQRLMSAEAALTVGEIQDRIADLDETTSKLRQIGILDKAQMDPFQAKSLNDIDLTQKKVMTLYVTDTERKLAAIEDFSNRSRLLLRNVNRKYEHKQLRIDREHGLVAEDDNGKRVALSSLSSGEQHEIVLHYDLLFKVSTNTIVLVDEPEISLHVAWQKAFLPELLEAIKVSNVDALVATHSPYIVGDRDDLMVRLG